MTLTAFSSQLFVKSSTIFILELFKLTDNVQLDLRVKNIKLVILTANSNHIGKSMRKIMTRNGVEYKTFERMSVLIFFDSYLSVSTDIQVEIETHFSPYPDGEGAQFFAKGCIYESS